MLRDVNIEGDVIFDLAIDSTGRVDVAHSRLVRSTHELFTAAVRARLPNYRWYTARRGGVAVSDVWRDTVDFVLRDSGAACPAATPHRHTVCAIPHTTTYSGGGGGMDEATRRHWRDSLAAGRARWSANTPRRYRWEVTDGCFCLGSLGPQRILVDVSEGRIVRTQRRATPEARSVSAMQFWRVWTVDSLFAAADLEVERPGRYIEALELDPMYGFPRRLHSDMHGVTDSWSRIDVRSFVLLR